MNDPRVEFISIVKELLALKDADFAAKSDRETMELGIRDLNLDSLEKMELVMKVEDTFKVMLDEAEVLRCEKIEHLYGLVQGCDAVVTGTLHSVVFALTGFVRWKIGNILLKLFVLRNRKLQKDQLFNRSWTFVQRFHWLLSGRQLYRNRFQRNWKSFALFSLVSEVNRHQPSFAPVVITKNHHILTEPAKQGLPIVVATIHTGTETSLNRMFEELGVKSSVIAASKGSEQRRSALLGLKGTADFIERSSDSFLIARRKMKDGKAICCCADFTLREAGTLYHDHYMAPGLFEFARRARARVIYAVPLVSDSGEIIINLSAPGISEDNSTAEELAHDFILFISKTTKEKYNWKLGSPQRPGSHPLYRKYCIARPA